ncbi:hypothetical protein NL393_30490, partial [Klebsiella pneumoniae]|nr:hypothetical protein [Klebsiella pneumoniae]
VIQHSTPGSKFVSDRAVVVNNPVCDLCLLPGVYPALLLSSDNMLAMRCSGLVADKPGAVACPDIGFRYKCGVVDC